MKTTTISGRGICIGCGHDIALNKDGTVRRHRTAADVWCAGSRKEPKPVVPSDPRRAQWIADARAVLDLLESNPDLPLNLATGLSVSYHPLGFDDSDDDSKKAAVDAVADLLGVAVTPPGPGSHYEARIHLGSASYQAVAVLKDYREEYDAIERLGKAALAEQTAKAKYVAGMTTSPAPVEYVDYAEAEAVREIHEEMALEAAGVESWEEL